jgi:DsbC/DsbD-like thiol-disulfide interchange protein
MFAAVMRRKASRNTGLSLHAGAVLLCLSALGGAAPAIAADASDWIGDARSAARLIAGAAQAGQGGTIHRAGVELRLAPGWKTYWRYPGDSGVPPHFDFSGSDNVANVTVLWPAPRRLAGGEDVTIGYKDSVIFPLRVTPQDAARPVTLRLKLDYAICEKLCIPVNAEIALALSGRAGAHEARLAAAEAAVPRAAGTGQEGEVSILAVRHDTAASPARVLVDVKAPPGATPELFAEGPSPAWSLPVPQPVEGAPEGAQRFAFALDGLPPGASAKGADLTLTAAAAGRAVETRFRLD